MKSRLPPLTGVAYRRQAFAEFRLLAFSFPLLIRLAYLLFRAGTWGRTAEQCNNERRNQKYRAKQLFHTKRDDDNRRSLKRQAAVRLNPISERHRIIVLW